jgi:transposase-like protein
MNCPRCKTSRLVDIQVTLREQLVTMHSCSRCDSRWWESEGQSLALQRVVELATGR